MSDTSNPEDEFIVPTEEIFDKTLEGKPVSVDRSRENKTAFMIKLNNLSTLIFIYLKIYNHSYFSIWMKQNKLLIFTILWKIIELVLK